MNLLRSVASHSLYWLGHFFSLLCDAIATDWPRHPEWLIYFVYRVYARFMGWSGDIDTHESVWISRRPGESNESFDARVAARWPDE